MKIGTHALDPKILLAAAVAGFLAVNGVLHLVDMGTVNYVLGILGAAGLYVLPSPAIRTEGKQ